MTITSEQHSATSLAGRLGVSRASALAAIAAGRLAASSQTIGLRKIYKLKTQDIANYKETVLQTLKARIARVEKDPIRQTQLAAAEIRQVRTQVAAESNIYTPQRLADRFGIGLEAASYILGRYATRVENGFKVDASALAKITQHIGETRGGGTIKSKGACMSFETLSRSEILERAASIRAALPLDTPSVINAADSAILAEADMISRERKSFGIASVLESLTAAIKGERAAAEAALERARNREAQIEKLLTTQSGIERAIQMETVALQRIEDLTTDYKAKTSTAAEAAAMLERFYARHDPRFPEHLQFAVSGITVNRLICEALPSYAKQSRSEIAALEAELQAIQKQISKLK